MKSDIVSLSEYTWTRTWARLDGLSTDEYMWEPSPNCWTVRPLSDGTWMADWALFDPDPPPLTTIAWRLLHLMVCYGSERNSHWLDVKVTQPPVDYTTISPPATASGALDLLKQSYDRWSAVLTAAPEEKLSEPLGEGAGQYREESKFAFVLHQLDEVIHHGAELGVLRDLYRATNDPPHADAAVTRLLEVGVAALDHAGATTDHPTLVNDLAALGRWDLVEAAVSRGFPVHGPAPTALHRAAGLGLRRVVDDLVAAGADPTVQDPQFNATAAGWARYFGHTDLADHLAKVEQERGTSGG